MMMDYLDCRLEYRLKVQADKEEDEVKGKHSNPSMTFCVSTVPDILAPSYRPCTFYPPTSSCLRIEGIICCSCWKLESSFLVCFHSYLYLNPIVVGVKLFCYFAFQSLAIENGSVITL